jgi:DNA invertase Pin-like site-specific DNA recombinase
LAEFERNLIRERTKAGLDAARARGRKVKLKPQRIAALKTMYESRAHTVEEVCAVFGISKPTLYRYLEGS